MKMTIRKLDEYDVAEIVEIFNKNVQMDKIGIETTIESFNHFLDEPNEEIRENSWVAVCGGRIVGYNTLCLVKDEELTKVYTYGAVDPDFRRKGIGTKLVKKSLEHIKERSINESRQYMYQQPVMHSVQGQMELANLVGLAQYSIVSTYQYEMTGSKISNTIPVGYTFRPPSIEDAADWSDIHNEAFSWRKPPTPLPKESVVYEFNDPQFMNEFNLLCVNEQNCPVGFISSSIDEDHTGIISTIGVRKGAQGKGIGKALLLEIINRMFDKHVEVIRLSIERANPTAAIHLYEKTGFKKYREASFYATYFNS